MTTTLAIIFFTKECHAVLSEQEICKKTKSIAFDFEDKKALSTVVAKLKTLYSKHARVIVNIPMQYSMMRDITVENGLSDAEIMQFLKSRAMEFFGHSTDQLCIDYEIQPTTEKEKQKITVIAAHLDLISHIQKSFLQEKIPIHVIQSGSKKMNLLPWREKQQKLHNQKIILATIFFSFFILLLCIILKYFFIHEAQVLKINTAKISKDNAKIILHHPQQHLALLQQLKTVRAEKAIALQSNHAIETWLSAIADYLLSDVTLESLVFNNKTIQLTGASNQLSDIHQYGMTLQQQFPANHVQLSEIHNDQQDKSLMHFTLKMRISV